MTKIRSNRVIAALTAPGLMSLAFSGKAWSQSNPSPLPPEVRGQIEAGVSHTLALTYDGVLWSWGGNLYGQLGDKTTTLRTKPTHLILGPYTGTRFKAIAASNHSAAIDTTNRLWIWGNNSNGQLGDGTTTNNSKPRVVTLGVEDKKPAWVACGLTHTVVADTTGGLWAWGDNSTGALGNGTLVSSTVPIPIAKPVGMGTVIQVAAGEGCSYALDSAGKIWAWGLNTNGRLGDNTTTNRTTPVAVAGTSLPSFRAISAKHSHVAALGVEDSLWTWGNNASGRLGLNDTTSRLQPTRILSGISIARVFRAGGEHSLAVADDHRVWGWGNNSSGQVGDLTTTNRLVPTAALTTMINIVDLSGGGSHSLGLQHGGALYVWGNGGSGQLGTGTTLSFATPTLLSGFKLSNDDSDADLLPDSWERFYFGNLTRNRLQDYDGDGLNEAAELLRGTNPLLADTDGDGITDGPEYAAGFLPLDPTDGALDFDGDGQSNYYEIMVLGTQPKVYDVHDGDGDGMLDAREWIAINADPNDAYNDLASFTPEGDADGDGLSNARELEIGSNAVNADTDGDGMADGFEEFYFSVDAVLGTGLAAHAAAADVDTDTVTNLAEFQAGRIPVVANEIASLSGSSPILLNQSRLRWFGVSGTLYRVRFTPDGINWETFAEIHPGLNRPIDLQLSELKYPVPTAGMFEIQSWLGSDDTDGDGMPNGWEFAHGLSFLVSDAAGDPDGDGLTNAAEYASNLDPLNPDSDGDGYPDPVSQDLSGYWKLDEESGANAFSSVESGNFGTMTPSAPSPTVWEWGGQGIRGTSLRLTATAGTLPRLALPSPTLQGGNQVTVSIWFKTAAVELPSATYSRVLLCAAGSTNLSELEIRLERTSGGVHRMTATDGNNGSTPLAWDVTWPLDNAEWHHCVLVRGSGDLRMMIDGIDLGTRAATLTTLSIFANALWLGQDQSALGTAAVGSSWQGYLDEVRFYRRAIDPSLLPLLFAPDDSDGDGLSDRWELYWFGNLSQSAGDDSDLDGVSNLNEYKQGRSPADYFNGRIPTVEVSAGNNQQISRGSISQVIKFKVTVPTVANPAIREAVVGVPVSLKALAVTMGVPPGRLSLSATGAPASATTSATTNASGEVSVYFVAPQ